ncbi:MAG: arsenate reductase ArsC [Akkermansia sp.]
MKSLLFLCTGNSCRSQMAEAFAQMYCPHDWFIASAGLEKHGINLMMLQVMGEVGADMSQHYSKTINELPTKTWDIIVTVCSHAEEKCPFLPSSHHLHLPFDDPPSLSKGLSNEESLLIYRRVRDEIKEAIKSFAMNEMSIKKPQSQVGTVAKRIVR